MKSGIMIPALAMAAGLFVLGAESLAAETASQTITPAESQSSSKGSNSYFTGDVLVTPLFGAKPPHAAFTGGRVTFQPGARSYWHTHPTGQHLLVLEGQGRTGQWEGQVAEIKAGDVVWCPPGVKHWHGASPDTAMTHIAITGMDLDGNNVEWLEEVSEDQYNRK